ncbi:tRNA uridine-5-carboxymethylaminomethyl(34) synthesis GTPase MnmE [Pelagicoccus sp. SDUM812002]|uniref:tRNA uridine-5-carboxymethylaminomethyl(34) synthesis GTPase MnmE n=1 Tax=Pelagicoccus sp. SDUM812002 TaxID=3041266 RepID=UPI00280CBB32|nr:tRNA uridine-5-carboxymethylaminomethyl(34) synthesis GTPase MnmE [Pelagicoccus sp. SDUM812002]MDQ8184722.1 tRNA uridine-5-carboxymethylaminomethyl(34) synthesis GTPase MnmE [Pelagicoccus sp. SDUM812002]
MENTDTVVALATPAGESAIALIRVTGPLCNQIARSVFDLAKSPTPRRACHGSYRDISGEVLDDVVYTLFNGPKSYTGEDVLEVSCHGNPLIATRLLEDMLARGCRQSEPGEFTRRAFLNGRMDLTQAEAVMELIQARSDRAIRVANNQLRGNFGRQLVQLKTRLLTTVATVEAYIDFPEEDLPPEQKKKEIEAIRSVLAYCSRIIDSGKYAAFLRDGVKTLILGEPNAGKSSLLNCLLGFERAIVSDEPGTTRDFIRERVILEGHCLQLMDTAGLREAASGIERQGIRKTVELSEEADLFLLVLDGSLPAPVLPDEVSEQLNAENCIVVQNKSDLGDLRPLPSELSELQRVSMCALSGEGLDTLKTTIVAMIDAHLAQDQDDLILVNARHSAALKELASCLESAIGKFEEGEPAEFVASELRGAVDAIGCVLGRIDTEDMLDVLFSSFCIGK